MSICAKESSISPVASFKLKCVAGLFGLCKQKGPANQQHKRTATKKFLSWRSVWRRWIQQATQTESSWNMQDESSWQGSDWAAAFWAKTGWSHASHYHTSTKVGTSFLSRLFSRGIEHSTEHLSEGSCLPWGPLDWISESVLYDLEHSYGVLNTFTVDIAAAGICA